MSPILRADIELGSYVRPVDVADDPDAVHAQQGRVYAVERREDPDTGETVDVVHVVRHHRTGTRWATLPVGRVGSVEPPNTRSLRSDIKGMARTIADGTRLPHDVERLADALGVFVRAMGGTK